jgi:hypothetical protein
MLFILFSQKKVERKDLIFFQKYFEILKIGQNKCPKMKTSKYFWEILHPHCIIFFSVRPSKIYFSFCDCNFFYFIKKKNLRSFLLNLYETK